MYCSTIARSSSRRDPIWVKQYLGRREAPVVDGLMQYWFNGTLAIDRHDILYRTGARPSINLHQFLIAPYIGDGSPVDQYMWVDNLTVATGRP